MSAGGISYDCLTTSRKATLPSTDMWGSSMNILKDPNKGIFTRRKDKVGDTQSVLLAQEDSGDRIAECINVYARGVNPMVSVSYNNYGNNGGQNTISRGHGGVKLPYRPEVFRPPVFRQEDLLPLSRQPRTWFYALTNPQMPDTVHQMECPDAKSSIQTKKLYHEAPSNKQYIKQLPVDMNEDIARKAIVENILVSDDKKTGKALPSAGTFTERVVHTDPKHIEHNKNIYEMFANKGSVMQKNNHDFSSGNGKINEKILSGTFATNKTHSSGQVKNVHDFINIYGEKEIQHRLKGETNTVKGSHAMTRNQINDGVRREGQHNKLLVQTTTTPFFRAEKNNYELSTKGKINQDTLSLQEGIRTVKNSNITKFIHLDPSNIKTKDSPCIPVESTRSQNIHKVAVDMDPREMRMRDNFNIAVDSTKSQNIHKTQGPIDLSTIQTKDITMIPKQATKTFFEQDSKIGERPEHRSRIVKTEMDTGGNKIKLPTGIYNEVQGSQRNDIVNRRGTVGGFDPRPQNAISNQTNRVELTNNSMINRRYGRLQSIANQEIQARQ